MTLASTAPLMIQLCGPMVIERDEARLPGHQGRLLFAYLVLNRHRVANRTELAEALWPDQLTAPGQTGLNPLISKLRGALGPDTIDGRSGLRLKLMPDSTVDVEKAVEAVHRAESQV